MKKAVMIISAMALFAAFTGMAGLALAEDSKPCPWIITKVGVGKWANGNQKAGTWFKGSFPINIPGVTERPDWYINGSSAGKSQIQAGMRFLPNTSYRLVPGSNTFKVQFNKPPYNGANYQCTISGFTWNDVPKGGYKWYSCR
jgi:hypothetical protein